MIKDLLNQRDAAGARYAAALAEWRQAFIELAALDQAIGNDNVGAIVKPTFGSFPSMISMAHPEFCGNAAVQLSTKVHDRRDEIIASQTTGAQ